MDALNSEEPSILYRLRRATWNHILILSTFYAPSFQCPPNPSYMSFDAVSCRGKQDQHRTTPQNQEKTLHFSTKNEKISIQNF